MSVDKLVDSTLLDAACTYEAGKIREKLGSSAQIAYDLANGKGFGDAIAAIPTGGGGNSLADLCNGVITRLDDDNITAFLVSLRGTSWNLQTIFLKNLEALTMGYCFANTKVETVVLPSLQYTTNAAYFFNGANSLTKIDIGPSYSTESAGIRNATFNGATAMNVLILRKTGSVIPLQNINAFGGTPFASGNAGGTLYVPQSSVTQYTQATNWSTILGYANNQIKSIESTHTDPTAPIDLTLYYADGTPIS